MRIVTSSGKRKLVLTKTEWERIGRTQGWIPRKLKAAETKDELKK